jgi:hypothetical protein
MEKRGRAKEREIIRTIFAVIVTFELPGRK